MYSVQIAEINSGYEASKLLGKYYRPGELTTDKGLFLKEDFVSNDMREWLETNVSKWNIKTEYEKARTKAPGEALSPYDIEVYFNGHMSYARPVKVYVEFENKDDATLFKLTWYNNPK